MKHYDYVEWILYKNKLLDNKIYKSMEEHLYICDECVDIFLSLIDELEIEKAGELVPINFTNNLMYNIKNIGTMKNKSIKKEPKLIKDFFIYYTAVASVAIFLTAGGVFGKLVDSVPEITKVNVREDRVVNNTIYKLSEEITRRTSMFINGFQISKNKEE